MTGRAPSGQALAVPATPANAVDGPSGFDPSRKSGLEELFELMNEETDDPDARSGWEKL